MLTAFIDEEAGAFAGEERPAHQRTQGFLAALFGFVGMRDRAVGAQHREDRIDVVFAVTVQAFEAGDGR